MATTPFRLSRRVSLGRSGAQKPAVASAPVPASNVTESVAPSATPELSPRRFASGFSGVEGSARPTRVMTEQEANAFMTRVIAAENRFYQDQVGYDAATGLTYDGHAIDFDTGALVGGPTIFSAASKESLHVGLLVDVLRGDPWASALLAPAGGGDVKAHALDILTKKITSYERFDAEYPGYGGFLPWYKIENGRVTPCDDWLEAVPGLDPGQLASSLYLAMHHLADEHPELAARYRAHFEKMMKNVVPLFYDPVEKKMRAEAKILGGNKVPPEKNTYANNKDDYFLDDAYEGLILCHFADLFGDWSKNPEGKEAIWAAPRREPATYVSQTGQRITHVKGHWLSAHEAWAYLVMPFRDVPMADTLYKNEQRARTAWSAEQGVAGLFASTNQPRIGNGPLGAYLSALGVAAPGVAKLPSNGRQVVAPYASFPIALVDKPMFATWLRNMIDAPRMWGPYGMGESYEITNGAMAPVLTWDGKTLPIVAWKGGFVDDMRAALKKDGLYDKFLARVEADYRLFGDKPIEGTDVPLAAPTVWPRAGR